MAIPQTSRKLSKALLNQQADQRVLTDRIAALEDLLYYVIEYTLINGLEESHVRLSTYMRQMEERWQPEGTSEEPLDALPDGQELPDS